MTSPLLRIKNIETGSGGQKVLRGISFDLPAASILTLIGPTGHDAVTHYVPDTSGQATGVSFTFDHHGNNALLRQYAPLGLDAKGVGHSHPTGCLRPSLGDLRFVQDCFDLASPAELDRFYLPIVVGRRLFPYVILRGDPLMTIYSRLILF